MSEALSTPSSEQIASARLTAFAEWAAKHHGAPSGTDYAALLGWSLRDPGRFWSALASWAGVVSHGDASPERALPNASMPGAIWFPELRLNYAENALRFRGDAPAIITRDESGDERVVSRDELRALVSRARAGLRSAGVAPGDRVAAILPNRLEAVVAFLATASLGAVWSCCSPEFGVPSILDRFSQIEPKVLIAVDHYRYGGRRFDRRDALAAVTAALPNLEMTVLVTGSSAEGSQDAVGGTAGDPSPSATAMGSGAGCATVDWTAFLERDEELCFEAVVFDHPLWILYSSGTTGLPKAIVHGHGGIVLEHVKALALHSDLGEGDRFFWFSTTGWMMWNLLVGGLLVGATVVLYDGHPAWPEVDTLWNLASELRVKLFGVSAPYLIAQQKAGVQPGERFDFGALRSVGSTGAPLPADSFRWLMREVKPDVQVASVSGGTDICTAFVLSCPWLPVHAGEIQCAGLGCDVQPWSSEGRPIVDEVGELVVAQPMPSMPVFFWGDHEGSRLKASYFERFPGVWHHGDWVRTTSRGSFIITGRSDSTLNRGGIRMGTSEFYRVVESKSQIADSLVIDTSAADGDGKLWLFIVLADGEVFSEALAKELRSTLRREISPRHVPDEVVEIAVVPRTLSGKKLEVPVKKILCGAAAETAANRDTLQDPKSLDFFVELCRSNLSPSAAGANPAQEES